LQFNIGFLLASESNMLTHLFRANVTRGAMVLACAMLACTAPSPTLAHELPSNRLTLVLRDSRHLSLTFYIDYLDTLHKTLAPERSADEFALFHAAMPTAEFQQAVTRAHAKLEEATRLTTAGGKALTPTQWRWPTASSAHALLQQRAMQSVANSHTNTAEMGKSTPHEHGNVSAVAAEVTSANDLSTVSVTLPEPMMPVLVVSYRPTQVWLKPRSGPQTIKF
jgi:hypothetical protein